MKKNTLTAFMVVLVSCACMAAPRSHTVSCVMGGLASKTNTATGIRGTIESVYIYASDGTSTGNVKVAYLPNGSSIVPAINISTGLVDTAKVFRPRVDATDVAGADLTSDTPIPIMLYSDTVRMIVSGSPTGITWTAVIVVNR